MESSNRIITNQGQQPGVIVRDSESAIRWVLIGSFRSLWPMVKIVPAVGGWNGAGGPAESG